MLTYCLDYKWLIFSKRFFKVGYADPLAVYVPVVTEERSHVR